MNTTKEKHILLLNRSFWPDIEATGQFLTELCEHLAERYRVTVIAGRSYYVKEEAFKSGHFYAREQCNDIEIIRIRHTRFWKGNPAGRIVNWSTYSILAFFAAVREKPYAIIACTDPPFTGILSMIVSRWRSALFIYNCRDIYPDVALRLGKIKKGFVSRAFDYLNRKALKAATVVVCLGESMAGRVKAKGVGDGQIRVITDWIDAAAIRPVPKTDNPLLREFGLENKFIAMYSGNIGLSQDFSPILQALSIVKEERSSWQMVFIGDGVNKKNVENEARTLGLDNVSFFPYQPREILHLSLGMADLHIVPLKKALAGSIVPSKIYGIMAAGRPYLAVTDRDAEPAHIAEECGCGLWAIPGNKKSIARKFSWALDHRTELEAMGKRARRIAETRFDKNVVIQQWLALFDHLV